MAEMHLADIVTPVAATPDRSPGDGVAPARRQRDQPQRRRPPHPPRPKDDDEDADRQVGTRLDVIA
jgi:hypothetical protein